MNRGCQFLYLCFYEAFYCSLFVILGPSYDDVCKIGRPDPDVLNCGRGGQDCKEGYYCEIASDDRYAKCCLKGRHAKL